MRGKRVAEPITMTKNDLVTAYHFWLCNLIDTNQSTRSYNLLARKLEDTDFYWSVPNDDNRSFEGKNLREQFCDENNINFEYEYFNASCSMLEMIVALAYRCESIMADQYGNMPMIKWFWDMMGNIGLSKFTDEVWAAIDGDLNVDQILKAVNDRTYRRNGQGSLFPLNHAKLDQRKVELWYQMNAYLLENYYGR
jgi:hypothetical protein